MAFEGRLEQVINRHGDDVFRICRAVLRDEHLGRDAAQETFLRLWRGGPDADSTEHVAAWLKRVALTSAIDLLRRSQARKRSHEGAREVVSEADAVDQMSPDREATSSELRACFDAAIEELPERQRTIFLLRHEGSLALKEVAELLDIKVSTVKTQFGRAVWKLQTKLAPFGEKDR